MVKLSLFNAHFVLAPLLLWPPWAAAWLWLCYALPSPRCTAHPNVHSNREARVEPQVSFLWRLKNRGLPAWGTAALTVDALERIICYPSPAYSITTLWSAPVSSATACAQTAAACLDIPAQAYTAPACAKHGTGQHQSSCSPFTA